MGLVRGLLKVSGVALAAGLKNNSMESHVVRTKLSAMLGWVLFRFKGGMRRLKGVISGVGFKWGRNFA